MKNKVRLKYILTLLNKNKKEILEALFNKYLTEKYKEEVYYNASKEVERLTENWSRFAGDYIKFGDLRLAQLLIFQNYLPYDFGKFYYTQDEDLLIELNLCGERDIYYWKQSYDHQGKKLKKKTFIPIKDLSNDHIKNIIKRDNISKKYRDILNRELKYRAECGDFYADMISYFDKTPKKQILEDWEKANDFYEEN